VYNHRVSKGSLLISPEFEGLSLPKVKRHSRELKIRGNWVPMREQLVSHMHHRRAAYTYS